VGESPLFYCVRPGCRDRQQKKSPLRSPKSPNESAAQTEKGSRSSRSSSSAAGTAECCASLSTSRKGSPRRLRVYLAAGGHHFGRGRRHPGRALYAGGQLAGPGAQAHQSRRTSSASPGKKRKVMLREPVENQRHWEGTLTGFPREWSRWSRAPAGRFSSRSMGTIYQSIEILSKEKGIDPADRSRRREGRHAGGGAQTLPHH
jgi:hypothetical protein